MASSPSQNCCGSNPATSIPIQSWQLPYPVNNDIMKETDDFLAAEVNKLSLEQRARALDDVHCVGEELQETPELIEQLLTHFEHGIQATPNPTYELAVSQNRSYVEDPSFRLRFLRANLHDVDKSVRQMMGFLEQKAKYFGNEKVAQDIALGDLSPAETDLMLSSFYHIQDGTDRIGRIVFHMILKLNRCEVESLIRVMYYVLFNILIPMPGVQTKGCVLVVYDIRKDGEKLEFLPDLRFVGKIAGFRACLPIRYSAVHLCLKPRGADIIALGNIVLSILRKGMPEHSKSRVRIHYSSDMEIQYMLRGYGIPIDSFPVDIDGNLRSDIINVWLYKHLEQLQESLGTSLQETNGEENNSQQLAMRGISPNDVLLGRGKRAQYHPGNIRFREFLESHVNDYDSTPFNSRGAVATDWAGELLANGVRFLKKENLEWVECSFEEIVIKVSQFFRTRRRSKKKMRSID